MQTLPCDCACSPVADIDHDHIIMGNLKIKIIKLCKLFLKVETTVKIELLIIKKLRKA